MRLVEALSEGHLSSMLLFIHHGVSVRGLNGVVITIHTIKHLIATMMTIPRHVVHHAGVPTAHAIGSKASRMRKSLVLMMVMKGSLMRERNLRKGILWCHYRCTLGRERCHLVLGFGDSSRLTSALNSLIAVLVVGSEILEEITIRFRHIIT